MTWARQNLTHFPKIAELRRHIEGDPEDWANLAWGALRTLLAKSNDVTITFTDPVMARTIAKLWGDWKQTCEAFRYVETDVARWNVEKTFKTAYLEAWRHRDTIPRDPVVWTQTREDNPYCSHIERDYLVDADYQVQLVRDQYIPAQPYPKRQPLPPEMRERYKHLLRDIGKGGPRYDLNTPLMSGRQNRPAPLGWDLGLAADHLADEPPELPAKLRHVEGAASDHPDAEEPAGEAEPDADLRD